MYLTYEEYREMGGTLDEAAFNMYGYEAECELKEQTHNRITKPGEAVKRCMARIIDVLAQSDITAEKVSSFSHDGLSQSFTAPSASEYSQKINDIIYTYLIHERSENGTPLLYRGTNR